MLNKIKHSKLFYKTSLKRILFEPHPAVMDTRKTLKWYWRNVNYDMNHGEEYKSYLIQRNEEKFELIPKNFQYDSCLIWLYDGDWIEMFVEAILEFNNFPPKNYKIVFLYAKPNPIQYDTAVFSRSWFNIYELPDQSGYRTCLEQKDIDKYNQYIQEEINNQYNLIGDYSKIFVGGFSQSGCMALYSGLTCGNKLGGIISFAGFSFDFSPLDPSKRDMPILAVNGTKDEVVIIRHARQSFMNLNKKQFNLKFIEEPGLYHNFSESGLKIANNLMLNKNF